MALAFPKASIGVGVILWGCTSFKRSASNWMVNYWQKATKERGFWLAFGDQKTCLTDDGVKSIE